MKSITVYADILFLVNFSMDYLALYMTTLVTHSPIRRLKLLVSVSVGALLGTIEIIFAPTFRYSYIVDFLAAFVSSFVMIAIVRKGEKRSLPSMLRESVVLWGVGTLLGGLMTMIISSAPYVTTENTAFGFGEIFVFCSVISCAVIKMFSSVKSKKGVRVEFSYEGKSYEFVGLCDSASFACEPITMLPAIIVSERVLGELGESLKNGQCDRLRVIPIKTAAGERILMGFVPDFVRVDNKQVMAVIASDGTGENYGGYSGIVPGKLL